MTTTLTRRRFRRAIIPAVLAAGTLISASPAQAAKSNLSFYVSVFPADYESDGITPQTATPSTGAYYANYYVANYDNAQSEPYKVFQVRGGAVIRDNSQSRESQSAPISILPGDTIRAVRTSDGSTIGEATFTGQPTITSSVLGQPTFAGTTTAGATSVSVSLERRMRRNENSSSYRRTGVTRPTNYYESIASGRLTSVGDTTFGGTFGTPIQAGDYVTASQTTDTFLNDVETRTTYSVSSAAGVVPPKDVVPPKVLKLLFGTKSLSLAAFLKGGLYTFVTLDEAGTVTQTLTYAPPAKPKVKPKTKAKTKKAKKSAVAEAAKAKAKAKTKAKTKPKKKKVVVPKAPILIGSASGGSTTGGETVALAINPVHGTTKALASSAKTGVTLILTTVLKDAAGNTTTSSQPYKLTAK